METNIQIFLIVVASVGCGTGFGALWGLNQLREDFENKYRNLTDHVFVLRDRIKTLEQSPYGIKKDGTPRAKPGRKAGV
jgi:hypothetical protein